MVKNASRPTGAWLCHEFQPWSLLQPQTLAWSRARAWPGTLQQSNHCSPWACSWCQQQDTRSSWLSCLVQGSSIKEPHTKVTFKTSATGRSAELTKSMLGKNTAKGKHQPQTALDSQCVTVITSFFWVFLGLLYLCPFILFILLSENAGVLLEQQFSWHRT